MGESDEVIKVVRTIEYIGPRWWIEETMAFNAVNRDGTKFELSRDKIVVETSRIEVPVR